jgi:ABC-type siderophore export system fused ATPase/permease subunit
MNSEKVIFGFFITLAAALNFGFWLGEMDRVELHNVWFLAAAIVVSLIATVLKFGDRTQLGAVHLATSLVADVQLIAAAVVWTWAATTAAGLTSVDMALIVSLSGGALLANVISVVLMISELITARR